MREEFRPAIEVSQADVRELERKTFEAKRFVNELCARAGITPIYPEAISNDGSTFAAPSQSTGFTFPKDAFFRMPMTAAARKFLELRRRANLGPASPREVYEGLEQGGYKFETRDSRNAITSVRGTLRTNREVFHRFEDGTYGLSVWYKKSEPEMSDGELNDKRRTRKSAKATRKKKTRKYAKPPVAPFIEKVMANGAAWTTEELRQEAIRQMLPGVDDATTRNTFHGALLGLKRRGKVEQTGSGGWRAIRGNNVKGLFDVA